MRNIKDKIVWTYWGQGWDKAPVISRLCLQSWKKHNPNYLIMPLDDRSLNLFLPKGLMPKTNLAKIDRTAYSDIIRTGLRKHYGGIWVDSTVLCTKPLDYWLYEISETNDFFAFRRKNKKREMICSWFLYAKKNTEIINYWWDSVLTYWNHRQRKDEYYWVHNLFKKNCENNNLWENTPKVHANIGDFSGPHAFCPYNKRLGLLTPHIKNFIDNDYSDIPCFKLNRYTRLSDGKAINYLLEKEKLI